MSNRSKFVLCLILFAAIGMCASTQAQAQANDQPGKTKVAIAEVGVVKAVKDYAQQHNQASSLDRVVGSMGNQLLDRMLNTRKFDLLEREDAKSVLSEQDFVKFFGDSASEDARAQGFKAIGADYLLILKVDNFQDRVDVLKGEGGVILSSSRRIEFNAVAKLVDTTTMQVKETANIPVSRHINDYKDLDVGSSARGDDRILIDVAKEMAQKIADRVIKVIYPSKVLSVRGGQVMLNWGDGTGINRGERWKVSVVEVIVDPDTGEKIKTEWPVGEIEIELVMPKFSRAKIIDDSGIAAGCVARPIPTPLENPKQN